MLFKNYFLSLGLEDVKLIIVCEWWTAFCIKLQLAYKALTIGGYVNWSWLVNASMKNFLLFITLWEDSTIILRNHHVNVVEVHSLIHSYYDLNYKWIEYPQNW